MAATTGQRATVALDPAYMVAFTDWLSCACAGVDERAARAVAASGDDMLTDVAFAATSGHVLDFDDTYSEGVAHVSATTAPAALVLAAHLGLWLGATLSANAEDYEAMAAVAAASHPALYDAGWHPTAVCGPIGAAVAASRLLELPAPQRQNAVAVAVLRVGARAGRSAQTARRSRSASQPPPACRQRCSHAPELPWIHGQFTVHSGLRPCSARAGRKRAPKVRRSVTAGVRSSATGSRSIRAAWAGLRCTRTRGPAPAP